MKNQMFKIEGMSCGSCVRHVTETLRRLDGVDVKRVEIGSAEVAFDEAKASVGVIASALESAGYPANAESGVAGNSGCGTQPKSGGGCCCG